MDRQAKEQELSELLDRVRRLEADLAEPSQEGQWPPRSYYTAYHVLAGFALGMVGAVTSLLFNVVGALIVSPPPPLEPHPLNLIRVYLTFPLGESALRMEAGPALAIGCCLYLATGMVLGMPFQLVLSRWFSGASLLARLGVVSVLALAVWVINFYLILSWLQPLLFGGRWIVDLIPWWVAALTHLVFGWTMVLVQPLGTFTPYRPFEEQA